MMRREIVQSYRRRPGSGWPAFIGMDSGIIPLHVKAGTRTSRRGTKTVTEGGVMLAVRAEIGVCAIAGDRD